MSQKKTWAQNFASYIETKCSKYKKTLENKQVVIWGARNCGQGLYTIIKDSCNIVAFCDDFVKDPYKIFDIQVDTSENLYKKYPNATYVIASGHYAADVIIEKAKMLNSNICISRLDEFDILLLVQYNYIQNQCKDNPVAFTYQWIEIYSELKNSGKLDKLTQELLPLFTEEKSLGILKNRLEMLTTGNVDKILENPVDPVQYFTDDCLPITNNEVMFDCGAYNGDSIKDFLKFTEGKYQKILAIEPDPVNFDLILKYVREKHLNNIELKMVVTGDHNGFISFENTGGTTSKILDDEQSSGDKIEMVKLDNFYEYHPTLVKMDIEGAELSTLKGCEKIIKELKPKLAVCVYHKPMDLFEIPLYLHKLVPEYKFRLRQHVVGFTELVLYAYIEN